MWLKKEEASLEVHQDDYHTDIKHVVQQGDDNVPLHNIEGGETTIIEGNLQ
jgi:hypothetical protein